MHTNTTVAINPNYMSSLLYSAVFFKISIFITLKIQNLHNKDPKRFAFIIFVLNAVFTTV